MPIKQRRRKPPLNVFSEEHAEASGKAIKDVREAFPQADSVSVVVRVGGKVSIITNEADHNYLTECLRALIRDRDSYGPVDANPRRST